MPAQGAFSTYSGILTGNIYEPFIRSYFDEGANANEDTYYDKMMMLKTTDRRAEHYRSVADLGPETQIGHGQEYPFEALLDGRQTDFVPLKYAKAIGFPIEEMDDDKYGVIARGSTKLGRSKRVTKEFVAAAVYNTGFTTAFNDGVSWSNAANPLITGSTVAGATTWSNRLATPADPSYTTLLAMITLLQVQPDESGNPLTYMTQPLKYIYHPDFHSTVAQTIGSSTALIQGGSVNPNASIPNAIYSKDRITLIPNPFLNDTGNNQSWLIAAGSEPIFWTRADWDSPKIENDWRNDTTVTRHMQRIVAGPWTKRGVVGTPGST